MLDLHLQVGRFVRHSVGIYPVIVQSSAQPRCRPAITVRYRGTVKVIGSPTIWLPVNGESLAKFLSQEYVDRATKVQCLAINMALAYHEGAHLVSGEPWQVHVLRDHSDPDPLKHETRTWWSAADSDECPPSFKGGLKIPDLFCNLVNDANDFTVVPRRWPISAPLTMMLCRVIFWMGLPLDPVERSALAGLDANTRCLQEFSRLHRAYVWYLRSLKVRYGDKIVTSIPARDPMSEPFLQVKEIVRKARSPIMMADRVPLIIDLFEVFKLYWQTCGGTLDDFLKVCIKAHDQTPGDTNPGTDAEKLLSEQGDPYMDPNLRDQVDAASEGLAPQKRGGGGSWGHKKTAESDVAYNDIDPPSVDTGTSRRVTQALSHKLVTRRIKSREQYAGVRGRKLAPKHLTDLFTDRRRKRLWRTPSIPTKKDPDCALAGIFDRSGSMSGEKEQLCRLAACTLYDALYHMQTIDLAYYGYGSPAFAIFEGRPSGGKNATISRIVKKLGASGNNDVPDATHRALDWLSSSRASRKVIVIVNDGDLGGEKYTMKEEIARARRLKVDVVMIGVGTTLDSMVEVLGSQNSFVLEDVSELPDLFNRVTLSRL